MTARPRFAVVVVEMHCGFFAYQPAKQFLVHFLNLKVTAKGQVANSLAHRLAAAPRQAAIDILRDEVENARKRLGLNTAIETLRKDLSDRLKALRVLGNLLCLNMSREEIQQRFQKHSVPMQNTRAKG